MNPFDPGRGHHDMGGLPAGPIAREQHEYAPWEKRVDAMAILLATPPRHLFSVDESRRNSESLAPELYDRIAYYERWIWAMANGLVQRGVITVDELAHKMDEVAARKP